ncbi:MBG domain-containing protein [uncultured Allobaculum sp.]|uniref:MBG domain-containing protein n=3 Tax=uncultured Allobaculum sp. TaxID=1187017 RepID=UPI002586AF6A|nr:MBG domain-containing protein [uncultured Allobaculum sp.]
MNKRDRLARFLTCLLPCSLILTALPVQAQDPVESSTEPAPAHSDFATPEAAPSQPAVKYVAFQEADASVPAEKPSTPASTPSGEAESGADTVDSGLHLPTQTYPAVSDEAVRIDLNTLLSSLTDPEPGALFSRSLTAVEGVTRAVIRWSDFSGTQLAETARAGYSSIYTAQVILEIQDGYAVSGAAIPAGWQLMEESENTVTLTKVFSTTRKEKLTIVPVPEDIHLASDCRTFSALMKSTYAPNPVGKGRRESNGQEVTIYYTYSCPDYSPTRGVVNTLTWTAEIADPEGLNLDDFECNVRSSGTILAYNPELKNPNLDAYDSWRDYTIIPVDIRSSFVNPYKLPVQYYWIQDDQNEVELKRGLLSLQGIGDYTLEMRFAGNDTYRAQSIRKTLKISPRDVSQLVTPSRQSWSYGQEPQALNLDIAYDHDVAFLSADDFAEGAIRNKKTGEIVTLSSSLPAGDYEQEIVLKDGIDCYTLDTPITYSFTVTKASPVWSQPSSHHIALNNRYPIDVRCNGDGEYTYSSSNPEVIRLESDAGKTYMVGQKYGSSAITVSVSETENYLAGSVSFDMKAGYIEPAWPYLPDSISVTYGDGSYLLNPYCTSSGKTSWRVLPSDSSAVSIDETGRVSIHHAGKAVLEFTSEASGDYSASRVLVEIEVKPKSIAVAAEDKTKTYGDPNPELTWTASDLVEGDTLSGITVSANTDPDAGMTDILVKVDRAANPDYSITTMNGKMHVERCVLDFKWSNAERIYNGQEQLPDYEVLNVIEKDRDTLGLHLNGAEKNAGKDYLAYFDTLENPNYRLDSGQSFCFYSIARRPVKIQVKNRSKTYGDLEPDLNQALVIADPLFSQEFEYVILVEREPGENAGTYAMHVDLPEGLENYELSAEENAVFTIEPKDVRCQWSADPLVYSGKAQAPKVRLDGVLETDTCEAIVDGQHIHAGAGYTVRITGLTNANYRLADEGRMEYSISPKPAILKAKDASKVYGEADPQFDFQAEGLIEGDTPGAIVWTRTPGETVGDYVLSPSASDQTNRDYAFVLQPGTLTITPRTVQVTWPNTDLIYNGKPQYPQAVLSNLVENDDCKAAVLGAQTDAGSYEAQISALSNPNYVLEETQKSTAFEIQPAAVHLSVNDTSKIFGEKDPQFEAEMSGWFEEEKPKIVFTREEGENAGEYAVSANVEALSDNYRLEAEQGTLTIEPRSIEEFSATLKDLLRENGTELEQTLEDLIYTAQDGKEYLVTLELKDHIQSAGGAYVLTIQGTQNFTGELKQSFVVLPANGPTFDRTEDAAAQIGQGKLLLETKTDPALPAFTLSALHEDILNVLADRGELSAMEMAAIADGQDQTITLHIQDRSADLAEKVPDLSNPDAEEHALAFSLALEHPFGSNGQNAKSTGCSVPAQMRLPEEMRKEGTELRLFALSNGTWTPIDFTRSADGSSISFGLEERRDCLLTSRLEEENAPDPEQPEQPEDPKNDKTNDPKTDPKDDSKAANTPDTAASLLPTFGASVISAGAALLALFGLHRKNRKDRKDQKGK